MSTSIVASKICSTCKIEKPFSAYGFKDKSKGWLRSYCKECQSIAHSAWNKINSIATRVHARKWKSSNKEQHLKYCKQWNRENPESGRLQRRKRRAIEKSAPGTHTVADIKRLLGLQRGCCAVCHKPLNNVYHVDHRIALARGGSNDWMNLQLLHPRCNMRKHAKDPIEFMQEQGFLL
ncbi:HNH endonuclease [Paraburkholderia phenazinium]|uniref:HNH endonuclease n=1 Tax=Paraburkholderia phenazinium TaxID=60549 RepID=A0A1G7ZLU6_9BURK|nr:HNH endonuclease signature motif containing protein [Paraburkholderia phenazinium]SDH09629.1 HNH endonuclease [Paraburkholderia phenazinium]